MTTILQASRELERRRAAGPHAPNRWPIPNRRRRWGWLGVVLLVPGTCAAAVAFFMLRTNGTERVQSTARPQPTALYEPARVPPAPASSGSQALPRVEKTRPTAPAEPAPRAGAPTETPERTPPGAPSRAEKSAPTADPGDVRVQSIFYPPAPDRRTVTLAIDGKVVTLRERQSAAGFEVQLILPRTVYLRHGADVFALDRP